MERKIISVSQINAYLRSSFDADPLLCNVAIRGEISNYKLYPSGHHYFSIKDDESSLKCVMFKSSAVKLKFRPQNGAKVICMGKISVYPRDGAYQLYCSAVILDGIGDLHAAFEQLKAKLAAQGLFDEQHKNPLPKYPSVIALITSEAGAAVRDMLRILRKRYPLTTVRIVPVRVQGTEAPAEIAAAIRYTNHYRLADLIITGRGGGSMEDLWAFNDEAVAHAIYESEIPVISAVGHEPDVTIADYVADLRAATPSNGAELAVPDQDALRQQLDSFQNAIASALTKQLTSVKRHLFVLADRPVLRSPVEYLRQKQKDLSYTESLLVRAHRQILASKQQAFSTLTAGLEAMSPLKVLSRGYSIAHTSEGHLLRSVQQTSVGEAVTLSLSDGTLTAVVSDIKER